VSGQAKRSRVRALTRWRRQACKLIAKACPEIGDAMIVPQPHRTPAEHAILGFDAWFDVGAARAFARRLIAMGDEQAVFEDWCRDRGLGPENDDYYAFRRCSDCGSTGDDEGCGAWFDCEDDARGGWPGPLAQRYASVMARCSCAHGCEVCRDARSRFTQAPMGRSLARQGQRLLDMLDGRCAWAPSAPRQPDECPSKHGYVSATGIYYRTSHTTPEPCPDCRGTGRNLRGVVPAIEAGPQLRCWAADGVRELADRPDRQRILNFHSFWSSDLSQTKTWGRWPHDTRTGPRGEHRNPLSPIRDRLMHRFEDGRLPPTTMTANRNRIDPMLPRWRRGELLHDHRQMRRDQRIALDEWSVVAVDQDDTRTADELLSDLGSANADQANRIFDALTRRRMLEAMGGTTGATRDSRERSGPEDVDPAGVEDEQVPRPGDDLGE